MSVHMTQEEMEEIILGIKEDTDRMRRALLGEAEVGHKGLLDRTSKIENRMLQIADKADSSHERIHDRIDNIEKRLDRLIWVSIGAGFGGALGGGGIVFAILRLAGGVT